MAARHKPASRHRKPAAAAELRSTAAPAPLRQAELDELQALLDRVPAPLEPLDVGTLDGFLCGVLVQPQTPPPSRWLPYVTDVDARALPPGFDVARIHALCRRRQSELDAAIGQRRWFDPWVFELEDASAPGVAAASEGSAAAPGVDAVYPWVAGFATALEVFPALLQAPAPALTEALALLYRHLAPDDLEDADELLAEIDALEPLADLNQAVEELVRATLLLADIGRPLAAPTLQMDSGSTSTAQRRMR